MTNPNSMGYGQDPEQAEAFTMPPRPEVTQNYLPLISSYGLRHAPLPRELQVGRLPDGHISNPGNADQAERRPAEPTSDPSTSWHFSE
jgi:hypothetical protein